ncbi:MAG: hypothetical protein AAF962_03815 [Actinomycetota bacterium]
MKQIITPSYVMRRDGRAANIAYTIIAVAVALAMVAAASGAGPEEPLTDRTLPDWFHVGGNVLSLGYAVLVLIPRTRILGAILAVASMFLSMYVNYEFAGVDFFVDAIAYNTVTIMLGSVLIGHYADDLGHLPRPSADRLHPAPTEVRR